MKENTVKITQNEGPNSIGSRGSVLLTITGDRLSNDELMDYGKDYLNDGDFQSANLIFNYVKNLAEKGDQKNHLLSGLYQKMTSSFVREREISKVCDELCSEMEELKKEIKQNPDGLISNNEVLEFMIIQKRIHTNYMDAFTNKIYNMMQEGEL